MHTESQIKDPSQLLILAAVAGIIGLVLFALANWIMRRNGEDIDVVNRRTSHMRDMGMTEQLSAFHSDSRNIPVALGMGGIVLIFGAICAGIGAVVWWIVLKF